MQTGSEAAVLHQTNCSIVVAQQQRDSKITEKIKTRGFIDSESKNYWSTAC